MNLPVSDSTVNQISLYLLIIAYKDILVSCGFLYKTLHCIQRRENHGIGLMYFLNKLFQKNVGLILQHDAVPEK